MKLEGGSFIKSPWYYRGGTRPVGTDSFIEYASSTVAAHALTIRATTTPTSTLMVAVGSFSGYCTIVVAGAAVDLLWVGATKNTGTVAVAYAGLFSNTSGAAAIAQGSYIGAYMISTADSINIATKDPRGGAGSAQYRAAISIEYFGR